MVFFIVICLVLGRGGDVQGRLRIDDVVKCKPGQFTMSKNLSPDTSDGTTRAEASDFLRI